MAVDTVFGWVKAKKINKWKSGVARWEFICKIIELIFIVVLYMLDAAFGITFLEYIGIFYFGACELASVVENYVEINGNLPDGTMDTIKKFQFSIGTAVVKKIKKVFDDLMGNKEDRQQREILF